MAAGLILGILFVGFFALTAALNGYALSVLWGWFFVPTLGLPQLGVLQAIGISIVVGYLAGGGYQRREKDETAEQMIYAVLKPVVALAVGWVVKSLM